MVEYVKSLIDESDVRAGVSYPVVNRESTNSLVYVIDDVGDEYPLYSHEYEKVESKPQSTEHSNQFIREETVVKKVLIEGELPIGDNLLCIGPNAREKTLSIHPGNSSYSKSEVAELARILSEIAEVME